MLRFSCLPLPCTPFALARLLAHGGWLCKLAHHVIREQVEHYNAFCYTSQGELLRRGEIVREGLPRVVSGDDMGFRGKALVLAINLIPPTPANPPAPADNSGRLPSNPPTPVANFHQLPADPLRV